MNQIKLLFLVAILSLSNLGFSQNHVVDPKKSNIQWVGKKIGGEHTGTIQLQEGSFVLKNNKINSGVFLIDMSSIVDTDFQDAEYRAKLEGHLKSDDFFGVEKFPTAKLVITESTEFKNNTATVKANLTIKGITNPIEFKVSKANLTFKSEIVVDRSKFDVKYGSKSFFEGLGDKLIYDDFTLLVNIVVVK
jgi:polyisoprenoid-binding protein YceI